MLRITKKGEIAYRDGLKNLLKNMLILPVFVWLFALCAGAAGAQVGTAIAAGQTVSIDAHGECRDVTNSGSGTRMVFTSTALEWQSFRDYPNGLTLSACAASGGTTLCAMKNGVTVSGGTPSIYFSDGFFYMGDGDASTEVIQPCKEACEAGGVACCLLTADMLPPGTVGDLPALGNIACTGYSSGCVIGTGGSGFRYGGACNQ